MSGQHSVLDRVALTGVSNLCEVMLINGLCSPSLKRSVAH